MARGREEEEEKEQSPQPEPKKGSKKLLIILAVAIVLVIGGAGGAYFLLSAKGGGHGEGKAAKAEQGEEAQGENGKAIVKNMDPFVVNLTDAQGTRYLKAVIQLEVNSELASQEIDQKIPAIRDDIISLLSSKSFEDIATEPGKRELKKTMLDRINKNLKDGQVTHIFFTEFVVQ